MATKVYKNTSKDDLNVLGIGPVPAGESVSISGNYLPHVIMENYPGLVDITDEPGPSKPSASADPSPATQSNPGGLNQ